MTRQIKVSFNESMGGDRNSNIHRIRNFAEELSLSLGDLGSLPMEQADSAIDHVVVVHVKNRKLSRRKALIRQLLEKHMIASDTELQ